MKLKHNYLLRGGQTLFLLVLSLVVHPLWASCSFTHNTTTGVLNFTIPPITIPQDTAIGTVLYSEQGTSNRVRVRCTASGSIMQGYKNISDSAYMSNNPLTGVYATEVPGIGIRASWTNSGSASFASSGYIKPYTLGISKVANTTYSLYINAIMELVVTGPISSGILSTKNLVADWDYDGLKVAELSYSGSSVNVTSTSCDLVEKNLVVQMGSVFERDFLFGATPGTTFNIQLVNCKAGLTVDFKLGSSGSSGLIDNYTLATIPGDNSAQGVGIQIVGINKTLMEFNKVYTVSANTSEGQSFTIPFTARYTQTGDITPGLVNAIATFEINYR